MEFDKVVGALATLVLVATIVERMLAFVFEHKWFVKLATRADGHSNLPRLERRTRARRVHGDQFRLLF